MNMYEDSLPKYYDVLYTDKKYQDECDLIKQYTVEGNLLDIGCGTMTHSLILSENFESVTGVDSSKSMIEVAMKKIKISDKKNLQAIHSEVEKLNYESEFNNVISMFNVVNHISSLKSLISFFESIHKSLITGGTFIFDCWNGVACTLDKPREYSKKEIFDGYHTIISETISTTDLFESLCVMKTKVSIFDDISRIDEFTYDLEQKLWTPNILKELLMLSGFSEIKIIPFFDNTKEPKAFDYRLTFISKKL
jgi:SAM-dependent methyltransferase